MNPLQTEGTISAEARRDSFVQWYYAYELTDEECLPLRGQTESALHTDNDTLTTLHITWQQCITLG